MNDGEKLVRWDAEWEDYEKVDASLIDAWCKEKEIYDSLDSESQVRLTDAV